MSAREEIATPHTPTSPRDRGVVAVVAHQRGEVEGHREPGLTVGQEIAVALVGLDGGAEAGELAHGPEAGPVHGGVGPAGERKRAGNPELVEVFAGQVEGGVERARPRCPDTEL